MKRPWSSLAVVAALLMAVSGCAARTSGRYEAAVDPASRYHFAFVRERQTGRWMNREFEIRVSTDRALPDPLTSADFGDRLSVQLFKPGTAESGGLFGATPAIENGYRVWRGADVMDDADLEGTVAYGVSVSWPQPGRETRVDPMEVFELPPLGTTSPQEWSAWNSAASMRSGAMGWWDQVAGAPPEHPPVPPYPFEMRWRLVFTEVPGRVP